MEEEQEKVSTDSKKVVAVQKCTEGMVTEYWVMCSESDTFADLAILNITYTYMNEISLRKSKLSYNR